MRVAYDPQAFLIQEYGGLSRYFCRLAEALARRPGVTPRIFAPLHLNAHLAELPRPLVRGLRVPRVPRTGRALRFASRLAARAAIARFRPEIVHETYYSPRSLAPRGVPRVVTVLDMIHELFPGSFAPRDPVSGWKRLAVTRADRVLCISESTRRDLLALIPLPAEKVAVVPLGFDPPAPFGAPPAPGGRPYLLYVGQRDGYKNFSGLLEAFAASPRLRGEFELRCFGGGPFTRAERERIRALGLPGERVTRAGGGDEALGAAYAGAALFVYPSRYEGFGIPPLEAMARDCPVACSATSSLPEVAGDAAAYFNPDDPQAIRAALEALLDDPRRRADLVARGRERIRLFSWDRCADATLAVYRELRPAATC